MRLVFIDIDNTLLDFDAYVKQTMQTGFAHFGLKPYEPYMFEVFTEENNRLWHQIEQGTLTFDELHNIRWCNIFIPCTFLLTVLSLKTISGKLSMTVRFR